MKLITLTIFILTSLSVFSKEEIIKDCNKQLYNKVDSQQVDSLTITEFVSFTVKENGEIVQIKVEKIECSEYDIKKLDKKAIKEIENQALRVIDEIGELDPIDKPTRYTQPIKMRLPSDGFLKGEKQKD